MNGRPTGRVGEFIDRDGALYATPAELRDLGFALPPDIAAGTEPILLASLPNVHAQLERCHADAGRAGRRLRAAADRTRRRSRATELAPLSRSGYGALLNYDVLGTYGGRSATAGQQPTGGALLDLRAFSPYGVLENSGLVNITPYAGQATTVRLGTTFDYADPDDLRRWRAGDVVSGAVSWSRSVRLGGGQVSSDFSLRPRSGHLSAAGDQCLDRGAFDRRRDGQRHPPVQPIGAAGSVRGADAAGGDRRRRDRGDGAGRARPADPGDAAVLRQRGAAETRAGQLFAGGWARCGRITG